MLSFADIVLLQNLKLGHKVKNNDSHLPQRIKDACTTDAFSCTLKRSHGYNTRNKSQLNIPNANETNYRNSFLVESI